MVGLLCGMLSQAYTHSGAGVIGALVFDTATHGADQMMVQRYLTARSERAAGRCLDRLSGFVILAQFALFLDNRRGALGVVSGPPADDGL